MTSRQIQSAEGAIVTEGLIAKFHTRPHRCCTQIIQSFSPRGAKYVHPHLIHGSFGGHESSQTNYLKTYRTDLRHISRVGRIMVDHDHSEISFSIPQGTLPWQRFFGFYPQK